MKGIEKTVQMIIDKLKLSLPAQLSATTIDTDGTVSLTNPYSYFISEQYAGYKVPAIYVVAQDSTENIAKPSNYINATDTVEIIIEAEGRNENDLTRASWRYVRSVYQTLNLEELIDTSFKIKIKVVGSTYSPLLVNVTDERRQFRKEGRLTLKVERYEPL